MSKRFVLTILILAVAAPIAWSSGQPETQAEGDDAELVTVEWFVNLGWYNRDWDIERPVDALIAEETGVELRFINSAGGTGSERLNAMIAADDLSDVITVGWNEPQFQELQAAGMVHPLNEVIPEHSPTLWDETPDFMKTWYTYEDGNWYGFANFFWDPAEFTEDNYMESNNGMVARKDIMEQLDITAEDFTTQDRMVEALSKVRDADLQYNGLDVVPLYFTPGGGDPGGWGWLDMFAVPREDRNGNLLNRWEQPEYLEHLLFFNRLYRENLITRENFTVDRNQINEKILSGSIFAMVPNVSDYQTPWADLYRADNNAEFVPVGPVRSNDGDEPQFSSTGYTGWLVSMIAEDTDVLPETVKLWEYLWSDEGQVASNYGIEGMSYEWGDDGRLRFTDQYIEWLSDPDVDPGRDIVGNTYLFTLYNPVYGQLIAPPPATEAEAVGVRVKEYFSDYVYNETAFNNLGPLGVTDEAATFAEIRTYWEAQLPKVVLAESEAQAREIYAESVEQIKRLGMDEVLAVQNERFQANKEKLGWDFAWPPLRGE